MRSIGKCFQSDARRWASVLLIGSLVTGSISLVSFAQPSETEPIFKVSVSEKTPKGHSRIKIATNSDAYPAVASDSDTYSAVASGSEAVSVKPLAFSDWDNPGNVGTDRNLSDWLQQSETEGDFVVCHLDIDLEKIKIIKGVYSGRDNYLKNYLKEDQRIEPDWRLKYSIHVNVCPSDIVEKGGASTSWSLGIVEGLKFPEEGIEIPVILSGVEIGTAVAYYTDQEEVIIETGINEEIGKFASYNNRRIYFYYNLDVGFEPVCDITQIDFILPGSDGPIPALLLASELEESSPEETNPPETTPEETTPEETSPPETTPEETTPEETSPPETTPEETSPPETKPEETTPEETNPPETTQEEPSKGSSGSGSSGDSGDRWKPESTSATTEAVPTTSVEETIRETTVQETQKPKESKEAEKKDNNLDIDKKDTDKPQEIREDLIIDSQTIVPYGVSSEVVPGEKVTFQMTIRNDGEEPINNIRVRDYLPEHTVFVGSKEDGVYGVLNGRQRVTWKIGSLNPGEEKRLAVEVRVFECTPEGYSLHNEIFWETESEDSVNAMRDPSYIMEFSEIIVR